jgi:CheY-like chemotaxis protein
MSDSATATGSIVHTATSHTTAAPALHVLLADSDDETRGRRETQLRDQGFRVSLARTGFEAIVKASCQVPDLILVDRSLPDIEAAETCRLLTTCPVTSHIPVVQIAAGRAVPQRTLARLRRLLG